MIGESNRIRAIGEGVAKMFFWYNVMCFLVLRVLIRVLMTLLTLSICVRDLK